MTQNLKLNTEKTDQEIVADSLKDAKHFKFLYERYELRLKNYIFKISGFGENEALDILQDSFIKAWINLYDFDQHLSFSSWIYRIVHNETISQLRKNKSYGKNNTVSVNEEILNVFEEDNEKKNENQIIVTRILVDQLPLKYKEVIALKYYEKMSYIEISDILKISEGTVATRINRAKKQLKKQIEKVV